MKSIIRPKQCLLQQLLRFISQVHFEIFFFSTLISKLIFHSDLNTFLLFSRGGGCVTNKCFGSNLDLSLSHSLHLLRVPRCCLVTFLIFRNKFLTLKFLHNMYVYAFSKSFINYREFSATCHVLSRFIYHWH